MRGTLAPQRVKRAAHQNLRDGSGCVIAAFLLLPLWHVPPQIQLVCLAQHAHGDLREVQVRPVFAPFEIELSARSPPKYVSERMECRGWESMDQPRRQGHELAIEG